MGARCRQHQDADPACSACQLGFGEHVLSWRESAAGREFPWRVPNRTDYQLVLAEILLQRTRAEQVAKLFPALIAQYPDWETLAGAERPELEGALTPLGLQHRRAASLIALANAVLVSGCLPSQVDELMRMPGVGQYVSRMIALQRGTQTKVGAIDVNVARVLERVFGPRRLADIRDDPYLQVLAVALLPDGREADYTLALLDFAASICRPRGPRCDKCPIRMCRSRLLA